MISVNLIKPAWPDDGTSVLSCEYALDFFLFFLQSKLHYVMFFLIKTLIQKGYLEIDQNWQ